MSAPPADQGGIVAACRRLHSAIDRLDHAFATALGITRNDLRCLNLLEHRQLSPNEIAQALNLTSGSVTALVDRLERSGLASRTRSSADRRSVAVAATPRAFQQLGPLYRGVAEQLVASFADYPRSEQAAAERHLDVVTSACEQALAAGPKRLRVARQ